MNFKQKYQITETTILEPNEIMDRIQFELKRKKYTVNHVTDQSVSFKDNLWRPRWNFEPHMIDEGEFVINDNRDNGRLLTLTYYWRYYPFLLVYSFILITAILNKVYEEIWFFGIFFAIVLPIDLMRSKNKARELIANILNPDVW